MVIVSAVDQTDHAPRLIREGRTLADAFDVELHVLHVLSQSDFADLEQEEVRRTGQPGGKSAGEEYAVNIAGELAELGELSDDEFTAVGLIGDPSNRIVRYADESDARYIVLGGRKRSPIGKAVFGSTTQSVLMNTDQSVVTVMRDGGD